MIPGSLPVLFIVPVAAAGAACAAALGGCAFESVTIDGIATITGAKWIFTLVDSHCHYLWLYIFLFHILLFWGRLRLKIIKKLIQKIVRTLHPCIIAAPYQGALNIIF